ncbi:two-component system sensor protein [Neisseria elongata]|jgi:sensor histidine kinase|uniref:histidine kinase n=1 Tax=Neisseria elongata TaxID=495 RepID=A0A378U0C0_NEIEL|nr:HAMP domain-containing sensor histidine kinase [Neisseria elongata]SFG80438.1 two-component system, NtrC family, sensor histidine kinase PilS [Neisseria elongata subsp. elongata]STZ68441.1 two-component system sensor protein [Neisseria elongata]
MDKSFSSKIDEWNEQVGRIPWLLNVCRLTILLSMFVLYMMSVFSENAGLKKMVPPTIFYIWAAVYAGITLISIIRPHWVRQENDKLPNASAVVDIVMIMALVYLTGGIGTGVGILVLPFVATSCMLSYGKFPALYAGFTTVCILCVMFLSDQLSLDADTWDGRNIGTAIMLIGASFAVAYLTSYSATFLRDATASARKHKRNYNRVRGLNQLVLNRVQEAVIVIDPELKVWLFNRQAKNYFSGLAAEHKEPIFEDLVARWLLNPEKPFEADIHLHRFSMHVRAVPMVQEDGKLLMLFLRSLREIAAEAMATKLASLGQLTANLAHEIRNPMSAIRHANDLLQEGIEDPVSKKLHGIIDGNIRRIDKMLEDVSTLNKKDNLGRESINLMKFWLAFKQEFTLNNPSSVGCIKMEMQGKNLTVTADPMHVQQIMWNLCNNAWRHSTKGSDAIQVSIKPSGKLNVSIVVSDDGPGAAPEIRNQLFEPFFTTEKGGTGLGLYVARELAHANLGQLHYHPELNGFELILPKDNNHEE